MKILDLKLKAFGPFLEEQHIDFTKLNDKGMFLINGPTGTGKTSLFDAIVFALYGKGSGKDRDDGKSLRSDFAKENEITYVDLTFEANGQIYRIYRQPAYVRKAKKGDGFTSENSKAELYMPDGSIICKPKDVDEKLANDILFINIDQFKSIALLAQGEFTELITASSKDRAAILEHIFQKETYDDFQKRVTELSKKAEDEAKSFTSSVNTLINKVEGGEEIVGFNEALSDPSNIPTFIENLKELIKKCRIELKEKQKLSEESLKDFNDVSSKLNSLKRDNQLIGKYLKAIKKLKELEDKKAEIEISKSLLEVQTEFDKLKPFFDQLKSLNKTVDNTDKEIKEYTKKLIEIDALKKWLDSNLDKYKFNKNRIIELSTNIRNLNSLIKEKKVLETIKLENESYDSIYKNEYETFLLKENDFKNVENRFFASSSYNLAKSLMEGEPCPVCGSIHHPALAHFSNPVSEVDYKKAKKECDTLRDKVTDLKSKLDNKVTSFKEKEDSYLKTLNKNGFPNVDKEFIYSNKLNEEIKKINNELVDLTKFNNDFETKKQQVFSSEAKYKQGIISSEKTISDSKESIARINNEIDEKLSANNKIKTREAYIEKEKNNSKCNIDNIKKLIGEYENSKIEVQTIIDNTPKELIDKGNIDESKLLEECNEKNNIYQIRSKETNTICNKINNLEKDVKDISEKYENFKSIINKANSLSELSKTANGANRMKLSFKMYVLADYFDKIIAQANRRLSKITNGRYTLIRSTTLGKGNAQLGLDLNVFDIETGKQRPASSLSGGEKFVSALSMALGLSDIIETNHALIQVESIFIDEGFGTLDENYLDMAMKALETLKDDNKTVAIISHVEKLKEYIPDGLEIKKAEIGSNVVIKDNI